jgi:hypothetical protein
MVEVLKGLAGSKGCPEVTGGCPRFVYRATRLVLAVRQRAQGRRVIECGGGKGVDDIQV